MPSHESACGTPLASKWPAGETGELLLPSASASTIGAILRRFAGGVRRLSVPIRLWQRQR